MTLDTRGAGFLTCIAATVLAGGAASAGARQEALGPPPSRFGGLHRAAAVLETTLDVHRLALVEIVAASRKILEAGRRPDATPETPVPETAAAVLARMAKSVVARVPADVLPAVARAYEAEAVDALETTARARRLDGIGAGLRAYAVSVGRLLHEAEEVIDLFSRARPIETRVVDSESVLDDITEALDELARAEHGIARARQRPLSAQLQAFLRLELALRRALDLIAEAQESGIHLGFEAPVPTGSLAVTAKACRGRLVELNEAIAQMEEKPRPLAGVAAAWIKEGVADQRREARVTWEPPDPGAPPAALRVYRSPNKKEAEAFLADVLACDALHRAEAERDAQARLEGEDGGTTLAAQIAPGRSSFGETLTGTGPLYAPPRYRVVPVSAFGVEGTGVETVAVFLPRVVEPPPLVTAHLAARNPADPAYYREGDLVRVRWQASRNELPPAAGDAEPRAFAAENGLPVATEYRLLRVTGGSTVEVARVPAGTREAVDRPPLAELEGGVAYVVETLTDTGAAGQQPRSCRSATLQAALAPAFHAAAAGLAHVRHPTAVEGRALERLKEPRALNETLTAFAARPAAERERLLETWWTGLADGARRALLRAWPEYVSKAAHASWLAEASRHLSTRDRPWVMTEVWLVTQPPFMQREIERWWDLQDERTRTDAVARWRTRLDGAHAKWVQSHLATGDLSVLRPVQVLAWWGSRDTPERERIEEWWTSARAERDRAFADWLHDQPLAIRLAVRWPDWTQRSDEERELLLAEGYRDLPDGLMIHMLAWLDWHDLQGAELDAAVAAEVGALRRLTSAVRWKLRPVDVALGFRLWGVSASAAVLLALALAVRYVRRRRLPRVRQAKSQS